MPSVALKIAPSCHPARKACVIPWDDLANGSSQIPLITAERGTLKSETPRPTFKSYQGRPAIELENALPTSVDEPVSILLLQVKEPCTWKPRWNRCAPRISSPLYEEFSSQIRPRICPAWGLMTVPLPAGDGQR